MIYYIPCSIRGKLGYAIYRADNEFEAEEAFRVCFPKHEGLIQAYPATNYDIEYLKKLGMEFPRTHSRDIIKGKGKLIELN